MNKVKVGVIGSGFQADVHCASFQIMPEAAEVIAVASPTPGNARALADRYGIARATSQRLAGSTVAWAWS